LRWLERFGIPLTSLWPSVWGQQAQVAFAVATSFPAVRAAAGEPLSNLDHPLVCAEVITNYCDGERHRHDPAAVHHVVADLPGVADHLWLLAAAVACHGDVDDGWHGTRPTSAPRAYAPPGPCVRGDR